VDRDLAIHVLVQEASSQERLEALPVNGRVPHYPLEGIGRNLPEVPVTGAPTGPLPETRGEGIGLVIP
jgi:hypothetical protein